MLHRKTKEGDRITLRRGGERIYVFVRQIEPVNKRATLSISAPRDWQIDHEHAEQLDKDGQHG